MRKIVQIFTIGMILCMITGCGTKGKKQETLNNTPEVTKTPQVSPTPETKEPENRFISVKDYFPEGENVVYTYDGKGNEYASYSVYTDYLQDGRIQTRTNNGGTEVVKVLEVKEGKVDLLLEKPECYYRENFLKKSDQSQEIILQEPLEKGNTWMLSDNRKRFISSTDTMITTPLGEYETIEVTTQDKDSTTLEYYAKGVGLVKTIYTSEGMEVSSTLSEIKENMPLTQTVDFYYPDAEADIIKVVSKQLSFETNDITRMVIEKAVKELPMEDFQTVLTTNAKINSLYLQNKSQVFVDFNQEFVDEMNAGSGIESMILQCIANTIGNYYGVKEVYLTVENKPYTSGHIEMEKGETIKVKDIAKEEEGNE